MRLKNKKMTPAFKLLFIATLFLSISSCNKDNNPDIKPRGNENAFAVYNQAYQENYEADNIDDIIANAKNAYILIDPFQDKIASFIPELKKNNNQVSGYISIGTGEDWRSDFEQLKPYLVTKEWGQWPGEYFLKKITPEVIAVMKTRIDSMAKWGCEWVEFDNMDWVFDDEYRSEYGIETTPEQGIAYFNELAEYLHQKGMKAMAKNTVEGASNFDGVLYESYNNDKNWWDKEGTRQFLNAGKPVIINHYNETNCDKVYIDYMDYYDKSISYICEDATLKKYVHYNE